MSDHFEPTSDTPASVGSRNLPVPLGPQRPRPSLTRYQVPSALVSQLLAEKQGLAVQRARRRASGNTAIGAYAQGAARAERRMPAGYRLTTSI